MEEQTKPCPRCGSTLIVQIGNARHCNACSLDFDLQKNPIAARAQTEKRGLWTSHPDTQRN
jgi:hypothetical protein